MNRAVMAFLILFFCAAEASAGLLEQGLANRLRLADLLEPGCDRYFKGSNYSRFPEPDRKLSISPDARRSPLDIIYSHARARMYAVQPDDTLKKIARMHGVTIEHIKGLNSIKSDRLRAGQRILIPDEAFSIEISKPLNRLYLRCGDALIKAYPVSTGRSAKQTPAGIFFIQTRYPFPTWFHKGTVVSPASPDNYLGSRWLGFDKPQFGIHGTIFPEQIGQSVSKGCIRMKNEDVEELYAIIPVGTMVVVTEDL